MRKKNLTKAVETTVAPNPKEVDIWVEPKDDNTVSLKYYDYHDDEWKGGSDGGEKLVHIYGDLYLYDALAGCFDIYYDPSTLRGWMNVFDADDEICSKQEIQGTLKEVPYFNDSKIIVPVFDVAIDSVQQQENGTHTFVDKLKGISVELFHAIPCQNVVYFHTYRSSGDSSYDPETLERSTVPYYDGYILMGNVGSRNFVQIDTSKETIVNVVCDDSERILFTVGITNSEIPSAVAPL